MPGNTWTYLCTILNLLPTLSHGKYPRRGVLGVAIDGHIFMGMGVVCVCMCGGGGGIYVQPMSVLHKQDFPHLQPSPVNVKCIVSACPGSVFCSDVGNQLLQILCWIFFWLRPSGSITPLLLNPSHPLACIDDFVYCIFIDAANPQRGITGSVHLAVYWPTAVLSLPLDLTLLKHKRLKRTLSIRMKHKQWILGVVLSNSVSILWNLLCVWILFYNASSYSCFSFFNKKNLCVTLLKSRFIIIYQMCNMNLHTSLWVYPGSLVHGIFAWF